jgi:hypothetical protein
LVLGIPVIFTALLFVFRRRRRSSSSAPRLHATADGANADDEKQTRAMAVLGPLVACYRPSMHWFELGVTLRRIVLALVYAYVPESNLARSGLIELMLLGSLAVQHWLAPYRRAVDNRLEELALGTAATTFAVQSVWRGMNQLETATLQEVSVAGSDFAAILVTLDWCVLRVLLSLSVARARSEADLDADADDDGMQVRTGADGTAGGAQRGRAGRAGGLCRVAVRGVALAVVGGWPMATHS